VVRERDKSFAEPGERMSVDHLLGMLKNVKKTRPGHWIASCPTRNDKHPSMSIRELDDGRILVHDFGGDSTQDILQAVGLTFADLFPEKEMACGRPIRPTFPASDILCCIGFEALVTAVSASTMAKGIQLTDFEKQRLMIAAGRINAALDVSNGYR
jgi:hypothetical protein